jgi:hypothetical protein
MKRAKCLAHRKERALAEKAKMAHQKFLFKIVFTPLIFTYN